MNMYSKAAAIVVAICVFVSVSSAGMMVNGNLESWPIEPFPNPLQVVPTGWTFEVPAIVNGVRTRGEGLVGGSNSALAHKKSMTHAVGVYQGGIHAPATMATIDYLLAASQPTAGGKVYHLIDSGVYNQPGFWRTTLQITSSGAVLINNLQKMTGFQFSVDANGDLDFNDAGDTKKVYRIRFEFLDHDGVNSHYNVYISAPNVLNGTFANQFLNLTSYMVAGNPTGWLPVTGLDRFSIYGANPGTTTTHLEVIDNMSVTSASGITQLFPYGPAYTSTAETRAAVTAETLKEYGDAGGRPLPLASTWAVGTRPDLGTGLTIAQQLDYQDAGYPVLVSAPFMHGFHLSDWRLWSGGDAVVMRLAATGAPYCLNSSNWDSVFYTDPEFIALSDADTGIAVATAALTVSAASATNPVTITTTTNHGLQSGNSSMPVWFSNMTGGFNTLNGKLYTPTVTGSNTFTIAVNGSGFTSYAGSGTATQRSRRVSPMGSPAAWYDAGLKWFDHPMRDWYCGLYPNPPRVLAISNNESMRIGWMGIDAPATQNYDRRYVLAEGASTSLAHKAAVQHYRQIEVWGQFFNAMRDATVGTGWEGILQAVGYNACLTQRFRTYYGWYGYGGAPQFGDASRPTWQHFVWDGSSPEIYDNNWQWTNRVGTTNYPASCKAPFLMWSPQNEAMALAWYRDLSHNANPDAWFEISTWDGDLYPGGSEYNDWIGKAHDYETLGIPLTPEYARGWMQYCMWILKPRCVREFRSPNDEFTGGSQAEQRWEQTLAMVSAVHQEPTLREFWRHGTLVENPALIGNYVHPFQAPSDSVSGNGDGVVWNTYPRNYHLATNLDHPIPPPQTGGYVMITDKSRNVYYPVYTMAHVIGNAPNRQWLVYAHSTGIEGLTLTDVQVTIPGYQTITLPSVPVEGAFYHVVE